MLPLLALLSACTDPADTDSRDTGPAVVDTADTDPSDSGDTDDTDTAGTDDTDTAGSETGDTDTAAVVTPPPPCGAWGEPRDMGFVLDPELEEISGVAPSTQNPGVLWVLEDHAGAPVLYALDFAGNSLGSLTLDGVENVDWEAIAIGPCDEGSCLWVGDIGDNDNIRTDIALLRVREPEVGWGGGLAASATPTRFPIAYPDGISQNAEALALTPDGTPVIFTKRIDGLSEVFALDTLVPDTQTTLRLIGQITTRDADTGGLATSADIWPDGSRLLLRTYDHALEYDLGTRGIEGVATAPRAEIPMSNVMHVESVAYDTVQRGYWQIPEAVNAPIAFTPCTD
jgi:hypothetical protein